MRTFEIGQVVMWRGSWGQDAAKRATVIGKGEENGEIVYDLDNGHWAYANQLRPISGLTKARFSDTMQSA